MDHSFLCSLRPGGNAQPFVGDEESLQVGWFDPDDLPSPLAESTVERMAVFRDYLKRREQGDRAAVFRGGR